ncbi:amidohydrolase family protein [Marinirhabdus gelatinilytica]|uniref:Microsomal dipeptidase-like Zn-dependent dipeptidase n=1 Tax=Marinirhabdus gelatinilytica TaxID=1703343 RepID=A0A370Q589_9FLAO|nr:membrane dipeptidase [Marinirhabdus gelatinilytica]RDK83518.1 microsomal dipeptidase-like Zn-dependent dipeptidase [Marinirhabdus gelatinilytica]
MKTHYVDVHCHPSLKPYSKSFKYEPPKQNALDAGRKNSIWHYSPPTVLEKFVNRMVTLTKFTQTDMSALARSGAKVVVVSLYPFEKHFLSKRVWGWKGLTDVLVNLAASISQSRIDAVMRHNDYFEDLMSEYDFYKQLDNQVHKIDAVFYTYRLVNSYAEILENQQSETKDKKIINIVLSIEGAHAFNTGLDMNTDTADPIEVIDNLKAVKNWPHKPVFITFAHHFYNELCGHARSISIGALRENQDRGLNTGITELGMEVINRLLSNTNGPRIPLDVKHMSTASRKAYYNLLDTKFKDEKIPVIASHGAVNGQRSIVQWDVTDYPERAKYFNNLDINFFDEEVVRIAMSNGLLGIQLDERRIGSKKAINQSKIYFPNKRKQLQKKSLLVWRQVEHIAEVLNKEGLFGWGIQSIGSDFDGIVNPIKGLWTAENIKDLGEEMLNHANDYLNENREKLLEFNRISGASIVERVLQINAMEFLENNFRT